MKVYAALLVALAGRNVEEVAAGSGVGTASLIATSKYGTPMALEDRERVAAYLGTTAADLFRVWSVVGGQVVDLEPALNAAPSRYVTDPAVLRTIDRRSA